MRRSCAPSIRKKNPLVERKDLKINGEPSEVSQNVRRLFEGNENHVLELEAIKKSKNVLHPIKNNVEIIPESVVEGTRFNVVWAKMTTKKHKTWEGDGTVVIVGRTATLRDSEGKFLGSSQNIKNDEFIEGARMFVGSKEVELIEKVEEKVDNIEENIRPPLKKVKTATVTRYKAPISSAECPVKQEFVPLIMKSPSYEHQWKYNTTKKPVEEVSVPECLTRELRPHQREGVSFLYECVMGYNCDYFGAILADEMGLGKTLQCIALIYTLMKQSLYGNTVAKRILIVTPSSLVENWDKEITKWLKNERIFTFIVGANNKLKKFTQSPHIPILLISYEMLVNQMEEIEGVRFDLMICDEGHRLKNNNIKAALVLNQIDCKRRILLTGTPIQNDLQEFYALIDFVNPGMLGTYQEFKNKYETPIVQSQQPNILPQYQELGRSRAEELSNIISGCVLRRTHEVIKKYLPQKQELVIFCLPSKLQELLLSKLLTYYNENTSITTPLQLITILKKICNHPSLIQATKKNENDPAIKLLNDLLPPWQDMGPADSGKLGILESLLEQLVGVKEKLVIVSYYAKTLDMIMGLCDHYNYKHCRLDGTTPSSDRSKIVATFNNPSSDIFVFLLSAKAGGTGLNLIGASRLVLFDNDWNPASDLQAMSRIWRDGQTKKVFIYRLITCSSIEEKIYQRQISKTSLSGCVVDQRQNLNNLKFSNEELKDLFSPPAAIGEGCLTHEMLNCECAGDGTIPDLPASSQESNKFELNIGRRKAPKSFSLKMQELMRWEHHKSPIREDLLAETCLQNCRDDILFIFQNKTK